jgi:hypothetical protein
MTCKCKICRNNLTESVNKWYVDGFSLTQIVEKLQQENKLTITEKTVQRHLETFNLGIRPENTNNAINLVENQIKSKESLEYDLNNITFDKYNFDDHDPISAITYLQKAHLHLYLRQLEIVCNEQERYYKGEAIEVSHGSIIRLKMLFDLLDNITGISLYANQQAAIQKIESMGLKVERFSSLVTTHENVISNSSNTQTTEED